MRCVTSLLDSESTSTHNQNLMDTLCIDVGNTSTHYGLVTSQNVCSTGHFPTHEFDHAPSQQFAKTIAPLLAQAQGIAFCSVVPAINANLRASLTRDNLPIFHLTHETCSGLNLAYPKPGEIGQDRIANAIAAQEFYGTPAIVIDMGTAVTFDILTSQGYEGGIIAPGLALMTKYLHEQTALLPELKPEDLLAVEGAIGKSTIHAMKLGVAVGYSGMIEALLTKVTDELESRGEASPIVLSTGGSIANLTKDWIDKSQFIQDLTLMGLAVAYKRQVT
ncbi:MAG: type III pantothenate kinase [Puniceicoccaceae bacterium]|nr:MAG: type III pantothenate kinase [Puniceicoccaceae bacterium]